MTRSSHDSENAGSVRLWPSTSLELHRNAKWHDRHATFVSSLLPVNVLFDGFVKKATLNGYNVILVFITTTYILYLSYSIYNPQPPTKVIPHLLYFCSDNFCVGFTERQTGDLDISKVDRGQHIISPLQQILQRKTILSNKQQTNSVKSKTSTKL